MLSYQFFTVLQNQMMKKVAYCLLCMFLWFPAFAQTEVSTGGPAIPVEIFRDLMKWLYYERDQLFWSAEYITLDSDLRLIPKKEFLEQLATGRFLPLRINKKDQPLSYQLYVMDSTANKDVVTTIKNMAQTQLHFHMMEGTGLPEFEYADIAGNIYNPETTKGKIVVINCWFVRCKPCVAEIPDLNMLVKKYAKKGVVFIALTFDSTDEIKRFLKDMPFAYGIVPDMESYLGNHLKIQAYPTHLVISRNGLINKVIQSNKIGELTSVIEKELSR